MRQIVSYIRVSTGKQGRSGLGIEGQWRGEQGSPRRFYNVTQASFEANGSEESCNGVGGGWGVIAGGRRIRGNRRSCRRYDREGHRTASRSHSQRGRSLRRQPSNLLCLR
jgi:hypothetical protein